MIKQNSGNVMIALLAVGLLIGVGAWFVITGRDVVPSESTPTVTPNPTPEIQELTSNVDTSDWIESSHGESRLFSFKYPPTWEEQLDTTGFKYNPKNDTFFELYIKDPGRTGQSFEELTSRIIDDENFQVLMTRNYLLNGREVFVMTNIPVKEKVSEITTEVFVANIPYPSAYPVHGPGFGEIVFTSYDTGNAGVSQGYFDTLLEIVSTLEVLDE
ncbi:hypothetical protein GW793_00195 [bacterium]|nr:hypothetical protein [bacterium]